MIACVSLHVYDDSPVSIQIGIVRDGYGSINNLGELTGEELRIVARMRDTVQQWVDGAIDELPPSNVP